LVLLRESMEDLIKKNYKLYQQQLFKKEWEKYLSKDKKWRVLEDLENEILVECNIEDAVGCIARGYGIYEDRIEIDSDTIK
jgi:hypothetical protein